MGASVRSICTSGAICFCNIIVFVLALVVLSNLKAAEELNTIDLTSVEQIQADWSAIPFTSITVRSANQGCSTEEWPVFSVEWKGTIDGCYTTRESLIETKEEFDYRHGSSKNKPICNLVRAVSPVQ